MMWITGKRQKVEQPIRPFLGSHIQMLVAHRGFSGEAPENTLPAYKKAVTDGAFHAGEADIRLTSDGVWVCLHDSTVDRTTDGTGSISAMTLEDAKQLDAGSWFHSDYAGTEIPTLEEFLQTMKMLNFTPWFEIKPLVSDDKVEEAVKLVEKYFLEHLTVIKSFSLNTLKQVRKFSDDIFLGWHDSFSEANFQELKALKNATLMPSKNDITQSNMEMARKHGMSIVVYTVDITTEAKTLITEYGITGMYTNVISSLPGIVLD